MPRGRRLGRALSKRAGLSHPVHAAHLKCLGDSIMCVRTTSGLNSAPDLGACVLDRAGTTPASRGHGKVHRWFFVRENRKGSNMDMSAADIKRAASAQPQNPPSAEPNGSEILVRSLQAEGVKF